MYITFSGIDGAGKTTHINLTVKYFMNKNYKVKTLRMYDNVSVSAFLRKNLKKIFRTKGKKLRYNSSEPSKKSFRMDKNRKGPVILLLRQMTYPFDLIISLIIRIYYEKILGYIIIFDRYLFDSIANLAYTNKLIDYYSRFFLFIVPKPDIAILLDIDAEVAFSRKPEYPLAYNRERRNAYLNIFSFLKKKAIIRSEGIEGTQQQIEKYLQKTS